MRNIEERIGVLEDNLALTRLLNGYHLTLDRLDWDAWIEVFTADAEVNFIGGYGTMKGKAEIFERSTAAMRGAHERLQHVMLNLDFDIDCDAAQGTGDLLFAAIPKAAVPTRYFTAGGRYSWRFQRTPAGWRIAAMTLEFIWTNDVVEMTSPD